MQKKDEYVLRDWYVRLLMACEADNSGVYQFHNFFNQMTFIFLTIHCS
jgi:hypothetical protein